MAKAKHAIPPGWEGALPYLIVEGAAAALDFYARALGATIQDRIEGPGGKVMHAELKVGRALFMLADAFPDMGCHGPKHLGGSPVSIIIYVEDVDAAFARAIQAGGKEKSPVRDQFYGDRSGTFVDPFGHTWTLSTHVED